MELKVHESALANVPEDLGPGLHMTSARNDGFPVTDLSQRWLIIACDPLAWGRVSNSEVSTTTYITEAVLCMYFY